MVEVHERATKAFSNTKLRLCRCVFSFLNRTIMKKSVLKRSHFLKCLSLDPTHCSNYTVKYTTKVTQLGTQRKHIQEASCNLFMSYFGIPKFSSLFCKTKEEGCREIPVEEEDAFAKYLGGTQQRKVCSANGYCDTSYQAPTYKSIFSLLFRGFAHYRTA